MKRMLSLLLVLTMVLSLFTGCRSTQTEEKTEEPMVAATTQPAETAEPTTEPTTEPTLSPEEIFIASLPERMREGYETGFVELDMLEDLERSLTVGEASKIIQAAYVSRCGVESKTLNALMTNETYNTREANLWWMSGAIALADVELIYGDQYEDYEQWWTLCRDKLVKEQLWNDMCWLNYTSGFEDHYYVNNDYAAKTAGDKLYAACTFWSKSLCDYGSSLYDQTNGVKVLDEETALNEDLLAQVNVEEVVEFALRFANSAPPIPNPDWVAPEKVDTYDPSIITPDILEKETNLPAASCSNLPSEWHGIVVEDLYDRELTDLGAECQDQKVYEYEIQVIKDAGFNFIGLNINFSLLQSYNYSALEYYDFTGNGDLDENKLKELDQVLAWCMKNDIHLDIRAAGIPDSCTERDQSLNWNSSGNAEKFAAIWQALARRYADIPNEYLSFTVFTGEYGVSTDFLMTAVEAIRAESPERCIIADIYDKKISAEAFAEMGVALSYKFAAAHSELFDVWGDIVDKAGSVANFSWPYKGSLDAQALMNGKLYQNGPSANEVMAIAQEYGVGFMLSDFGIHTGTGNAPSDYITVRFPDEEYHAMITDIISTMESQGYGWCFAHWYGSYGLSFGCPVIENTVYEQIENYPCYVDQTILGWFKEINSVK